MKQWAAEPGPWLAALAANIPPVAGGLYLGSYDAYTHIFFADHYRRSWFSLWETRWYGGFSLAGYTPLSHQLMALIAPLTGLEAAYGILLIATLLLLIAATRALAGSVGLESRMLPWLVAFTPGLYLFLYIFGQLPGVLATALMFAGASRLTQYLQRGGLRDLGLAAGLSALAFHTHHITFAFLTPLTILVAAGAQPSAGGLRRMLAWMALSGLLTLPIALQLLSFLQTTPPQAPIPHASRGNVLVGPYSWTFFWGIYGPIIILTPLALQTLHEKKHWPLMAITLFYLIMGLGGSTPIPRLLLGPTLYEVLTYEKFGLWAALLLTIPLAYHLENRLQASYGRLAGPLKVGMVASLLAASILVLSLPSLIPYQPPPPDVEAIASYLNSQPPGGFYITIGLGTWSRKLSILTQHPTLDGGFNTARRLPILAESGLETIDGVAWSPTGPEFLQSLLQGDYGIRWVVLGSGAYQAQLRNMGFAQVREVDGPLPVTIWERPGYEEGFRNTLLVKNDHSLVWGLLPPATLLLVALLSLRRP